MKNKIFRLVPAFSLFILLVLFLNCSVKNKGNENVTEALQIDHIWAGCPVNFDILTAAPYQYVAYYDSSRYMCIAQRNLSDNNWTKTRLPSQIKWDSHNYITMALDSKGHLHVSGNMHVVPLVYFQSDKPYDASSLKQRTSLIGSFESAVTYPKFFNAPNGDLIFTYRIGSSGKGNQIYNRYNAETQQWSRLLDTPLVDGEGKSNAYLHGPIIGPDGYFHLVWVWRMNPDANSNCNISYSKSKDLIHWEKSDGSVQQLPITMKNCDIIDPIPVGNGLLNGNTKIGFDLENRVIVSYHKYDEQGNIQIFNARSKNNKWHVFQATDWNWKWNFGGWGSMISRVGLSEVAIEDGQLIQSFFIDTVGHQKYLINEKNLHATIQQEYQTPYLENLRKLSGKLDSAQVNIVTDLSKKEGRFVLRWETLKRNRDKPYNFIPKSQPLLLYQIKECGK